MARVTAEEVAGIYPATGDFSRQIIIASRKVDNLVGRINPDSGIAFSEDELTDIELYYAAHLISRTIPFTTSETAKGVGETKTIKDDNFKQMVMDLSGGLLLKIKKTIRMIPI